MNEVRAYIKEELENGVDEKDIIQALQDSGHELKAAKKQLADTKKSLNRFRLVITGLLILLILAAGAYFFVPTQQPQEQPQEPVQETVSDQDLLAQALNQNDQSICQEITDEQLRTECQAEFNTNQETYEPTAQEQIIIQALEQNDPTLCEQLQDEQTRAECQAEFGAEEESYEPTAEEEIIIQAIQEDDITLCQQLTGEWRTQCEAEF